MINFTIGPVQSYDEENHIGGFDTPYFRNQEFSDLMLDNEKYIKTLSGTSKNSRAVFLTGSGTAAMEASVINTLSNDDKVLVVNGGSFGNRFTQLLSLHDIPFEDIIIEHGETLTEDRLNKYNPDDFTAFIVNMHETSVGLLYDMNLIHNFCLKNSLFLIVDGISSFLADEFNMSKIGADIYIVGSQKALACPPGVSIIVLSERAVNRVNSINAKSMYLDLKLMLENQDRGQTPFTPAVKILEQINSRLYRIINNGGINTEINRVAKLAKYFRENLTDLPFEINSPSMSNAMTPVKPLTASAYDIYLTLKDNYGIWICPNGGELKDKLFRVGHIGNLSIEDFDKLVDAFYDLRKKGII